MFVPAIGCEIHVELKTRTKLLCGCENAFGGEPNTRCCPVCTGLIGALPVLNRRAVELAVRAGLVLGSCISPVTEWERKNYFYPDLPKAWQTSQMRLPVCTGGAVEFECEGERKRVRITRIQLEEDAGKLVHDGGVTRVDYNRCGVPLIEIVTEPDMRSAAEVVAFLKELKRTLGYADVSDLKMQEGSLRCDVNVSVAQEGAPLGVRTETKNLGSFRAVRRAVEFEIKRQLDKLALGDDIACETRRFDEARGMGFSLRAKERVEDYMFFAEPDIPPVTLPQKYVADIARQLPELASSRIERYERDLGLSRADVYALVADRSVSDFFDDVVALGADGKRACNVLINDVLRLAKTADEGYEIAIAAEQMANIVGMAASDELNNLAVKSLLAAVWGTELDPKKVAAERGLLQSNDKGYVAAALDAVMSEYPVQTEELLSGNERLRAFIVGAVMRKTGGKANPKIINDLIDNKKV